jgi:hypothetical protein
VYNNSVDTQANECILALTVINKGRRLMDLTRKMALQDKMFYLCIAVAVAYSAFAIWTMYASLKLAGL